MLCIQTQASLSVGHGHVMRCLSLAEVAENIGIDTFFLCKDDYTEKLIKSRGFETSTQAEDRFQARWIIRDFQEGSSRAEVELERSKIESVMLLDEAGSARKSASIVTDSMMVQDRKKAYPHSRETQYLYGLEYAPLNPCFSKIQFGANQKSSDANSLLITFGAGEKAQLATFRIIDALHNLGFQGSAIVIASGDDGIQNKIQNIIENWNESVLIQNHPNMKEVILESFLVLTKLGMTMLEALACGRSCINIEPTVLHAELQMQLLKEYAEWPVVAFSDSSRLDYNDVARTIMEQCGDRQWLNDRGSAGRKLVDGQGSERLIHHLLNCK